MTVIMRQGGLWESDLPELIEEGESKGYKVEYGLEEDRYHYYIEWRISP
jgi:hypothetical protein